MKKMHDPRPRRRHAGLPLLTASRSRLIALFAVLAVLGHGLLGLASAARPAGDWQMVCTAQGMQWVNAATGGDPATPDAPASTMATPCLLCAAGAHLALLPALPSLQPPPVLAHAGPRFQAVEPVDSAPPRYFPARAPPRIDPRA